MVSYGPVRGHPPSYITDVSGRAASPIVRHAAATLELGESTSEMERRLRVSSPLQIAVLVLVGAALWGIFYIINVLSGVTEKPRAERGSTRRTLSKSKKRPMDT